MLRRLKNKKNQQILTTSLKIHIMPNNKKNETNEVKKSSETNPKNVSRFSKSAPDVSRPVPMISKLDSVDSKGMSDEETADLENKILIENEKRDTPSTVKGMRDILDDTYYEMQGFFEKAQEIAMYYGFSPISTPVLEHQDVFMKTSGEGSDIVDKEMYSFKTKGGDLLALRPEGTAAVMRSYIEHGMKALPQPIMKYYFSPMFRHDRPQRGRYRQHHQFGMEIVGSEKAISDALIIQSTLMILRECGAQDLWVDINSIGDRDSRKAYEHELKSYYSKHINELSALDRKRLSTNVLRILDSKEPKTIAVNEDAPDSISFLTQESKKHFKEVLEFLEAMNVPYRINKNLVRGLDYYTNTVFEIMEEREMSDEEGGSRLLTICGGGRYDYLARTMGHRKDIPGIGVGIGAERVMESPWWKHLTPRIVKPSKIYFIKLGQEAQLKSLRILEELRLAKIPVTQSLSKDSLRAQLGQVEKLGLPYALIFGQKEAVDDTVIVRDMEKRSQKEVPIDNLVDYIKKMK